MTKQTAADNLLNALAEELPQEMLCDVEQFIGQLTAELEQANRWCVAFLPLAESHYKRQNAEHKTSCDICRYWELAATKLQGSKE